MRVWIFNISIYFFLCHGLFSQHINRYNKHRERTGKWIVYNDSAKKIKSTVVRYRNGNPVGKGYYYTNEGILGRKEIIRFKKIKTFFYYPNGAVWSTGKARIDISPDSVHYYFYGKWKYYDEKGKLVKYCYYGKGNKLTTKYFDENNAPDDSLINNLNALERRFLEKNRNLINHIDKNRYDQFGSEKYRVQLVKQDGLSFADVEKCLKKFGYPSAKLAGEASGIPFFIICYASVEIKEKYVELFQRAVISGDLSSKTFAFFVDKLMLAKGEKQIYGTQYYFEKNKGSIYYPSIDPENLNKRRIEMGLNERAPEVNTETLLKMIKQAEKN